MIFKGEEREGSGGDYVYTLGFFEVMRVSSALESLMRPDVERHHVPTSAVGIVCTGWAGRKRRLFLFRCEGEKHVLNE